MTDNPAPDTAVAMRLQLGRPMRGLLGPGHICGCGLPDVAVTNPRLPDGSPFPTLFYLTCPRANSAIGTLEESGLMARMTARLLQDEDLALAYRRAHLDYLHRRAAFADVPEISGISAGGMPDRVKCLHVLAAHALAAGAGVNPFGDEVLELLGDWGSGGPCISLAPATD